MRNKLKLSCGWHASSLAGLPILGLISGSILVSTLVPAHASTELAKVNRFVITVEDFNKRYREVVLFFPLKPPTKKAFLADMIKREVGIQEAKRLGLEKDPEVIDRINTLLYNSLLERKLAKDIEAIQVTDAETKNYYSRHPEIRTSHIFVALPRNAKGPDQKKALEKIRKIADEYKKDGGKMSFAEFAQRYSEGPTAEMGGDIGYQSLDHLDPSYYEAGIRLGRVGDVSGIVRTSFGYHLIKLTAIESWEDLDPARRAHAKQQAFEEQKGKLFEKYMSQLQAGSRVTVVRPDLVKD